MKFAWPLVLIAAAIVPVLALLLHRWSEARALRKLESVIAPRLREQLLRSVDFAKRWRKALLLALGLAALLVAVARPQLGFQPIEVERDEEIDRRAFHLDGLKAKLRTRDGDE